MKLRIDYFDQNEDFVAAFLPQEGQVVPAPQCSDSAHAWHLLRLDSFITYELMEYSHFLIASRRADHPISLTEATSVFILLILLTEGGVADGFSHKQFLHIA